MLFNSFGVHIPFMYHRLINIISTIIVIGVQRCSNKSTPGQQLVTQAMGNTNAVGHKFKTVNIL